MWEHSVSATNIKINKPWEIDEGLVDKVSCFYWPANTHVYTHCNSLSYVNSIFNHLNHERSVTSCGKTRLNQHVQVPNVREIFYKVKLESRLKRYKTLKLRGKFYKVEGWAALVGGKVGDPSLVGSKRHIYNFFIYN